MSSADPATLGVVQLKSTDAVRLTPTQVPSIARVEVLDPAARHALTWDRYVRLHATAEEVKRSCAADPTLQLQSMVEQAEEEAEDHQVGESKRMRILDVGGYDGALGLFLPEAHIEVIDPATTGGSGTDIPLPDRSRPIVTSVDALEHVPPEERQALLAELARVAGSLCLINFPHRNTTAAQELALALTGNQLVREHVEFGLPSWEEVVAEMERHGFSCKVIHHADSAVWISQYVLQQKAPDSAAETSKYLIQRHQPHWVVPQPLAPLYDLIVCRRV